MIRLVIGLGNPGPRFEETRHNVGFMAVERFVRDMNGSWGASPVGEGLAAKVSLRAGRDLWVGKPHTYMNESGTMVGPLARYFKISSGEVLVVSDDMDLDLGRIRIRKKGSAGGQKGLASILTHLGTQEVPRLRLGIGPRPARFDGPDFVLGRFAKPEREAVSAMVDRAAAAIQTVCEEGVEPAMNSFNPRDA